MFDFGTLNCWSLFLGQVTCDDGGGSCDTDADGIPNDWETDHALNPNDATDAAKDPDGDDFTNLQEYLAGTDPHDQSSALRITAVEPSANDFVIQFPTVFGKRYCVDRKDDLTVPAWTPIAELFGTGGAIQITDAGAAAQPKRFYRVRLLP